LVPALKRAANELETFEGAQYPSWTAGKALRVFSQFEHLLRLVLTSYLREWSIEYSGQLRESVGGGKPIDKLTLGQVVGCLKQITAASGEREIRSLMNRDTIARFDRVVQLRRSLHEPEVIEQLAAAAKELGQHVTELLDSTIVTLATTSHAAQPISLEPDEESP
jgi:hypothetical protein